MAAGSRHVGVPLVRRARSRRHPPARCSDCRHRPRTGTAHAGRALYPDRRPARRLHRPRGAAESRRCCLCKGEIMPDPALIAAAVEARTRAYAPYSRFLVGAAIKDEVGRIHSGCNVENAAYPQGTCAEAGAIAAMVLAGGHKILEVAVVGAGDGLVTPCGG